MKLRPDAPVSQCQPSLTETENAKKYICTEDIYSAMQIRSKCSICLLVNQANTAFWLCTTAVFTVNVEIDDKNVTFHTVDKYKINYQGIINRSNVQKFQRRYYLN